MPIAKPKTATSPVVVPKRRKPRVLASLVIPLAPSVNAYYRSIIVPARGRRPARAQPILSREGNRYVAEVSLKIRQQMGPAWVTLRGPLRVHLTIYMERRGSDADNISKACLDALQASSVFINDKQICDLHLERYYDRADPRIEVRISEETDPLKIDAIGSIRDEDG